MEDDSGSIEISRSKVIFFATYGDVPSTWRLVNRRIDAFYLFDPRLLMNYSCVTVDVSQQVSYVLTTHFKHCQSYLYTRKNNSWIRAVKLRDFNLFCFFIWKNKSITTEPVVVESSHPKNPCIEATNLQVNSSRLLK